MSLCKGQKSNLVREKKKAKILYEQYNTVYIQYNTGVKKITGAWSHTYSCT